MEYTNPDPQRCALVTIDVQRDFTLAGAPAEIPGTLEIVPTIRRVLDAFRKHNRPIFHVVRLYFPDGSNVDLCRRELVAGGTSIVIPGSEGAEQIDDLRPDPGGKLNAKELLAGNLQPLGPHEWAMYKPRWGAFYGTRFEEYLHSKEIDTLVICGCNYPNCPRTTIYEASERDFRIAMLVDGTSGIYDRAEEEMLRIGVTLFKAEECIAWLASVPQITSQLLVQEQGTSG